MEEKIIKDLKDIIMKLDQETINNLIKKSTSKEDKFFTIVKNFNKITLMDNFF